MTYVSGNKTYLSGNKKNKKNVSGNKRITLNKVKFMPGNTKIHIYQVEIGVIYWE